MAHVSLAFLKMQPAHSPASRLREPDLSLTDKILRLLQKCHGIDYSLFPRGNHSDILLRELDEVFYRSRLTFEFSYFLSCSFPHIFQTLIPQNAWKGVKVSSCGFSREGAPGRALWSCSTTSRSRCAPSTAGSSLQPPRAPSFVRSCCHAPTPTWAPSLGQIPTAQPFLGPSFHHLQPQWAPAWISVAYLV